MSNILAFRRQEEEEAGQPAAPGPAYAELAVSTHFSFLRGASHPKELVIQAEAGQRRDAQSGRRGTKA